MINVVLVETCGEENIGSIARAMANMGVSNLILVNPLCDYLSSNSLKFALSAYYILKNAIVYRDFLSIKNNGDLSIAISRRAGRKRINDIILPELPDFLNFYQNIRINLVFGREANGLTNDEIEKCDLICSIPSSENFPSLNLSHAVIVVLYEIFKNNYKKEIKDFDINNFNNLYTNIINTLSKMNFFKNSKPQIIKNFIKKILLRAKLNDFEIKVISNIFSSINGMLTIDKKKEQ